jgi:hypothetical protein
MFKSICMILFLGSSLVSFAMERDIVVLDGIESVSLMLEQLPNPVRMENGRISQQQANTALQSPQGFSEKDARIQEQKKDLWCMWAMLAAEVPLISAAICCCPGV